MLSRLAKRDNRSPSPPNNVIGVEAAQRECCNPHDSAPERFDRLPRRFGAGAAVRQLATITGQESGTYCCVLLIKSRRCESVNGRERRVNMSGAAVQALAPMPGQQLTSTAAGKHAWCCGAGVDHDRQQALAVIAVDNSSWQCRS